MILWHVEIVLEKKVDALAKSRDEEGQNSSSALTQILNEMNDLYLHKDVILLAASNVPDSLGTIHI